MAQDMDVKTARKVFENRNEKLRAIYREIDEAAFEEKRGAEALRSAEEKLGILNESKDLAVGDLEKAKKRRDELLSRRDGDVTLSPKIGSGKAVPQGEEDPPLSVADSVGGEQPNSGGIDGGPNSGGIDGGPNSGGTDGGPNSGRADHGGDSAADADKEVKARTEDVARIEEEIRKAIAEQKDKAEAHRLQKVTLSSLAMKKYLAFDDLKKAAEKHNELVADNLKRGVPVEPPSPPSAGSFFAGGQQSSGDGPLSSSDDEVWTPALVDSGVYIEADGLLNLDKIADHEYLGNESVGASNSASLDGDQGDNVGDDGADQP